MYGPWTDKADDPFPFRATNPRLRLCCPARYCVGVDARDRGNTSPCAARRKSRSPPRLTSLGSWSMGAKLDSAHHTNERLSWHESRAVCSPTSKIRTELASDLAACLELGQYFRTTWPELGACREVFASCWKFGNSSSNQASELEFYPETVS